MPETCRGTLVTHDLPDTECTDPNCADCQDLLHALVIPCDAVDGDCPVCGARRFTAA